MSATKRKRAPKIVKCATCGKPTKKGPRPRSYCSLDCSIRAALDAQQQLHDHKGPVYRRWKRNYEASRQAR